MPLPPPEPTHLNVGCGSDDYQDGPEWVNLDRYDESAHHRNPTRYDVRGDAACLPFADESLEHVRIRHVLEHLERPLDVLREIRRVLAAGGTAYVEVPHPPSVRTERSEFHRMHLYSWTRGSLVRIARRAGFAWVTYYDAGKHDESMPGGHAVVCAR